MKVSKRNLWVVAVMLLLLALAAGVAAASTANSGAAAPSVQTAVPTTASGAPRVETCTMCHQRDGATHQTYYNELYQDGVIKVTDVKYEFTPNPDTTTITFKMTMNGQPFDPAKADELSIYWAPYKAGKFQFEPAADRFSLKGKVTADGKGLVTSKLVELAKDDKAFVDYTDVSKTPGILVIYGRDETQGTIPGTRVRQAKYPFAAIMTTGAGVDYASTANVAGCVKCHTDPYLKHGYIYGQVNNDPKTDFMTCKVCHLDNGEGGHYEWQLLVNDPALAAKYLAASEEEATKMLTDTQKAALAYNTTVMNDVHMSHAMEFPYPQSMSNCVTCHEGKLDKILTDENFQAATCKSCHPTTGAKAPVAKEGDTPAYDTTKLALNTLMGDKHPEIDWAKAPNCATCHKDGGVAPSFKQLHSGYDKAIYTATGIKYSDAVSVTITSATFKDNKLTVAFKAGAKADFKDVDVTKNVTPTVLVGLYGWDTKDFLFGPHERSFDDNKDGKIDTSRTSADLPNLEAAFGAKTANPRLTITSAKGGEWEAVADLTPWAAQLKDGSVKRAEVGILPTVVISGGMQVAVDATTRTVDLKKGAFDDKAFSAIVETKKCESCHAALATEFHNPAYGGSTTACRMCHITKAGGSHLEMQSRSLDSYVHAIHSGQAFDVAAIDFKDPVQALKYEEHIAMPYPTHGVTNCESCHVAGTYNPPTQDKSLPGLLSASAKNDSWDRNMISVPALVSGPAERACGGCHRAQAINEDKAGELAMLNQHFEQGGYLVPAGDKPTDTLMGVINKVMALFK